MTTYEQSQKTEAAAADFERVVYNAIVEAMRAGVPANFVIENLRQQAVAVTNACKIYRDVSGREVGWP